MTRRIAIISRGNSGLAATWLLQSTHDKHVFDQQVRLGGRPRSIEDVVGLARPGGRAKLRPGIVR